MGLEFSYVFLHMFQHKATYKVIASLDVQFHL